MKAMILAAGLGTRLKPWTLSHPKALVPVAGVPMLERVLTRLREQGFDRIVVNVHHFADQIIDFLSSRDFGVEMLISDERERLLDTGGAILHAAPLLCCDDEPVLIHNVDILSDAPLRALMENHIWTQADATMLTSDRDSSRRMVFNNEGRVCGWHNLTTGEFRPEGFYLKQGMSQQAFSGIHVISPKLINQMHTDGWTGSFSIIDFYLASAQKAMIRNLHHPSLKLIDIGKPHTLQKAEELLGR